jgi:DNA-binding NtrC family response regulator
MLKPKRILLIEDDPIFSKIFERNAKIKGLECTTCRNINEIAELLNFDFNAIVIDYNLGAESTSNGLELAELFAKLGNRTSIVLVSSSNREDIPGGWPFQVKNFICKKVGVENVVSSVLEITSRAA